MKLAIVYTSITGNTKELAEIIYQIFLRESVEIEMYKINEFEISHLCQYDAIVIGTYTWGNGDIPKEMWSLYHAFESLEKTDLITAVFGTGDSLYPKYCGAVDLFRDMLYVCTNLSTTLKVELIPQLQDVYCCQRFVESILKRVTAYKIPI